MSELNSVEKGKQLPERVFEISRKDLLTYADASGDQNPIHQDEEFAKQVGLPNVIAHGMYTMALAGRYVSEFLGPQARIEEFGVRFTKPVVVEATHPARVTFNGTITEFEDGKGRIEISAMCNDQKVLGQARALFSL
mgnify:FL=1